MVFFEDKHNRLYPLNITVFFM